MKTFTAYVEWDPETKLYVGIVPGLTGTHPQGATLDELNANMKEVMELSSQNMVRTWTCCRSLLGCSRSKLLYEQAAHF